MGSCLSHQSSLIDSVCACVPTYTVKRSDEEARCPTLSPYSTDTGSVTEPEAKLAGHRLQLSLSSAFLSMCSHALHSPWMLGTQVLVLAGSTLNCWAIFPGLHKPAVIKLKLETQIVIWGRGGIETGPYSGPELMAILSADITGVKNSS